MVYSGGRYVNYRYNAEGSLAELDYGEGDAAPTATYRFEYDSLGRLIRSQQRDGNTVTQRTEQLYDTANRLSAQGWTIGGTSYRESYAYDASDGSLTTLNTAVGTKIGYNYDALKRLRSRAIYQGSTPLFENRYAYATQSGNQSTALVEFFNYRLASDDGSGDIIVGYQYEYDNGGNITDIKAEDALFVDVVKALLRLRREQLPPFAGDNKHDYSPFGSITRMLTSSGRSPVTVRLSSQKAA